MTDRDTPTAWYLEGFDKRTDELATDFMLLSGVTTEEVRELLGLPESDPMHGVFNLPDTLVEWAERATGTTLDPERHIYQLEERLCS